MPGFGVLQMLPLVSSLFYVLIPLAPIAYVFIKWRAARNNEPHDRDLGIKVVFYYFQTLGYHLILIGLVLLSVGLLKGRLNDEAKTGVALILSGAIVYAVHALAIQTRFKGDPVRIVPRFYSGFNVLVAGLIAMVCLTACILILFNDRIDNIKIPAVGLAVYGTAWVFRTLEFMRGSDKSANPARRNPELSDRG
jgi:hypothetical protein